MASAQAPRNDKLSWCEAQHNNRGMNLNLIRYAMEDNRHWVDDGSKTSKLIRRRVTRKGESNGQESWFVDQPQQGCHCNHR